MHLIAAMSQLPKAKRAEEPTQQLLLLAWPAPSESIGVTQRYVNLTSQSRPNKEDPTILEQQELIFSSPMKMPRSGHPPPT
jgi:hypothetical protein